MIVDTKKDMKELQWKQYPKAYVAITPWNHSYRIEDDFGCFYIMYMGVKLRFSNDRVFKTLEEAKQYVAEHHRGIVEQCFVEPPTE